MARPGIWLLLVVLTHAVLSGCWTAVHLRVGSVELGDVAVGSSSSGPSSR